MHDRQTKTPVYYRHPPKAACTEHYGPSSWIELSRVAFNHNIDQLAAICSEQIAVVVKSNAYGHGLLEIGQLCQEHERVTFLCVALLSEALALRAAGITKPIMVMSFVDVDPTAAANQDIHFFVSTMRQVKELDDAGRMTGAIFDLHLKIDTGLSRFGVMPDDALALVEEVVRCRGVWLVGVCTHFAQSQICSSNYTEQQHAAFASVCQQLEGAGIAPQYIHCSNSSGALRGMPGCNMVRVGAVAYGLWPSRELRSVVQRQHKGLTLKPVLSWKTRIAELRQIPADTCVGYTCRFKTTRPTRVAILPVGYADGYSTRFFAGGQVSIGDTPVPIIGSIAMNTIMVDVTDLAEVNRGQEVMLLGQYASISVDALATRVGCNVREIMASINSSLPRKAV